MERKSCLFSIVMPLFNAAGHLEKSVRSVMAQHYHNWELLCVDDGSTDCSEDILQRLIKEDNRIKMLRKENGGSSSARNLGLQEAQGEYILFLDADDTMREELLGTIKGCIEQREVDYICFGYEIKGEASGLILEPEEKYYSCNDGILDDELEIIDRTYFSAVWNKVYKKSLIEKFQLRFIENLKYGEDFCFNIEFLQNCNSYWEIPNVLYGYFVNNQVSVTGKYDSDKWKKIQFMQQHLETVLRQNTHVDIQERTAYLKTLTAHNMFSCFLDMHRPECVQKGKEKRKKIKKIMREFGVKFELRDNRNLNFRRKIFNTILCTKSSWIIYGSSFVFYKIKQNSRYASRF